MEATSNVIGLINLAVMASLALVSWLRYRQNRDEATRWFGAAFGALAVTAFLLQIVDFLPTGLQAWEAKLAIAGLLFFPYLLYRFTGAFVRMHRWMDWTAIALTVAVVLVVLVAPFAADEDAPRGLLTQILAIVFPLQWASLSAVVSVRLWRAGRGQPTVARRRMRMLAVGSLLLASILVLSSFVSGSGPVMGLITQLVALGSVVFFFVGFSPPAWLRRTWRRREEAAFTASATDLMAATTQEEVAAAFLPNLANIVGARGTALVSTDGTVVGAHGEDATTAVELAQAPTAVGEASTVSPSAMQLDFSFGRLVVVASPYTPFFGQEEFGLVRQLAALAGLALSRTRLFEQERETRAQLTEAQRVAEIGSWEWDVASDRIRWSDELFRILGYAPTEVEPSSDAFTAAVHPEDRERLGAVIAAGMQEGTHLDTRYRVVHPDGSVRTIHGRGTVHRDGDGNVTRMIGSAQDVTERTRSELRQAELAAIVESSEDAIYSWTPELHVSSWNPGAQRVYGYAPDEIIGRPLQTIVPKERWVQDEALMRRVLSGIGIAHLETQRMCSDGRTITVSLTASPLRDARGEIVGVSSIARDITEQKRLEVIRDEFIANAAHELRTPLTAISGLAKTIAVRRQEMTPELLDECLDLLVGQGERARVLISKLLDISQLELGHAKVELQPTSPGEVVAHALAIHPPPGGVTVTSDVADRPLVAADPVRLEQIVNNLLGNAYRYGGSNITVTSLSDDEGVLLVVADDGPGVPDDLQPHLFEAFRRGEGHGEIEGSGLGLAICRRLAQAFDGDIWYERNQPRGARFVVRLRRDAASVAA